MMIAKPRRKFAGLALTAAVALAAIGGAALANQSNTWSPTTGTVSGLQVTTNYNNAFSAIQSCNSGAAAPANDQTAAAVKGQCWLNTSTTPNTVEMYDGTSWTTIGWLDTVAHQWIANNAGGTGTIASAATTDLGTVQNPVLSITGTTTITSFGTTAPTGATKFINFTGALTLTHNATTLILPNGGANITTAAGDTAIAVALGGGDWRVLSYTRAAGIGVSSIAGNSGAFTLGNGLTNSGNTLLVSQTAPTVQRFTSGTSLTYTPTSGMVRIRVRMCAGGGGGGASNTNAGSNGSDTSFGTWTAIHGSGGQPSNVAGGSGGTGGVNGTGTLIVRIAGGNGQGMSQSGSAASDAGGAGGQNPFAGAGAPVNGGAGGNAAANTGAGGAGGGGVNVQIGTGGGAGEYVEFWMTAAQVGAGVTYTVGPGGNGGTAGGAAGGNGAAGIIIIEEFYI